MKDLNEEELKTIDGGFLRIVAIIAGGLVLELITEGFEKCASDFKEGFKSANPN
jgi:lactobin A/cerein 7B family class IIb bacteriocin